MAQRNIAPVVKVPFTVESDSKGYGEFIEKLRKDLAADVASSGPRPWVIAPKSKVRRPVLDKETGPVLQPLRWIHVVLNGDDGAAPKLAIRSDNLYIMGFTNRNGTWFQLSLTGTKDKLVDNNPVMAGFNENYNTLLAGVENLVNLEITKYKVALAAATLWNYKAKKLYDDGDDDDGDDAVLSAGDPDRAVKTALATFCVTVCEAARFVPVFKAVAKVWDMYEEQKPISKDEVNYVKNWGDLSKALLKWKNNGYNDMITEKGKLVNIFQSVMDKGMKIHGGEQALDEVALVKRMENKGLLAWLKYFWGLLVNKFQQREDTVYKKQPKTSAIVSPL